MLCVVHMLFNMVTGRSGGDFQMDIMQALATIAGVLSTPSSSGHAVPPLTNSGGRGEQTNTQAVENLDTSRHPSLNCSTYNNLESVGCSGYTYAYKLLIKHNLIKSHKVCCLFYRDYNVVHVLLSFLKWQKKPGDKKKGKYCKTWTDILFVSKLLW